MEETVKSETDSVDFASSKIRLTEELDADAASNLLESSSQGISKTTTELRRGSATRGFQHVEERRSSTSVGMERNPARMLKEYFAFRDGGQTMVNAIKECVPIVMESGDRDGKLVGVWMLTEISHWDVEYERLVFLTEHTLIIVKYDLIQLLLLEYRRVPLKLIDHAIYGPLRYPENSIFEQRHETGLRILWNNNLEIPAMVNWNPFSEVPYTTFTDHTVTSVVGTTDASTNEENINWCKTQDFLVRFREACEKERQSHHLAFHYEETTIVIENYAGIMSRVFNKAQLGFFKARGRICF